MARYGREYGGWRGERGFGPVGRGRRRRRMGRRAGLEGGYGYEYGGRGWPYEHEEGEWGAMPERGHWRPGYGYEYERAGRRRMRRFRPYGGEFHRGPGFETPWRREAEWERMRGRGRGRYEERGRGEPRYGYTPSSRWPEDGHDLDHPYGYERSMSDGEIREAIMENLFQDSFVDPERINVDVDHGVAVLTGEVRDYMEARYAWDDAWESPGVRGVINNLTVRTDRPSPGMEMPQTSGPHKYRER